MDYQPKPRMSYINWKMLFFLSKQKSTFNGCLIIEDTINNKPLQLFFEKCQFFNQKNQWLNNIIDY